MASPEPRSATAPQSALDQRRRSLTTTTRRGIGWIYWIAGVSVVNTLLVRLGVEFCFVVGLGATQFVDGLSIALAEHAKTSSSTPFVVGACFVDALFVGALVLIAKLVERGQRWPLIVLFVCYALDTLILVLCGAWFAIVFHGLALLAMMHAFLAMGELNRLPQDEPAAAPSAYFPSDPPPVRPAAAVGAPPLPMILLGGVPDFGAPDPKQPAPTGLSRYVTGKLALIIGLVVLGGLAVCVWTVCKYCDDAVAMR